MGAQSLSLCSFVCDGNMRQHDICPLPLPYPSAYTLSGAWHRSRRMRRRLRSTGCWRQRANECALTLNGLAGHSSASGAPTCLQKDVLEQVAAACQQMGKPPADMSAAGAFQELCGSKLLYLGEGVGPVLYERDKVALPSRRSTL